MNVLEYGTCALVRFEKPEWFLFTDIEEAFRKIRNHSHKAKKKNIRWFCHSIQIRIFIKGNCVVSDYTPRRGSFGNDFNHYRAKIKKFKKEKQLYLNYLDSNTRLYNWRPYVED